MQICLICGKEFPDKHPQHPGKYCTRKCYEIARTQIKDKQIVIGCSLCNKKISIFRCNLNNPVTKKPKKNFFCNRQCYAAWKCTQPSTFKGKHHSAETIFKLRSYSGEKASGWIDGRTKHPKYNSWRVCKRKARLLQNGGNFSLEEWDNLKNRYNYTCPSCGLREPNIYLTVDHIIPISLGGLNNINNIQPLCKKCNSSKGITVKMFNGGIHVCSG